MSSLNTIRDDSVKHYSMVTKLVHYTSKFELNDDGRHSKQHHSTKTRQLSSNSDSIDKSNENRRFRLAAIWPEWNEVEINTESWDAGNIKKKETASVRTRADTKTTSSSVPQVFEDPEGKIELPPSLKVEQWKRPMDFLPPDKPPVIVDSDLGIQNFDLITSNEHLHYSETMRNIISQMTTLWDICRKERKNTNPSSENLTERTWRPWEHIYALNKVSKQPFIAPYNPAGKYVVRLFFLGTWRKMIIDDSMPFDSQNRCLLPQTTLSYELWPMLLSKALLKIISLDFNPSTKSPEYSETSVIHLLTGWIPEPIPLKYSHAEKIWNFLRHDPSNKPVSGNKLHPTTASAGPLSLFKWPDPKVHAPEEPILLNNQLDQPDDYVTKKSDDKNAKKGGTSAKLSIPKERTAMKSANSKENRTTGGSNPPTPKDMKKSAGTVRGVVTEDVGVTVVDQITPEAPKMIIFGTISHSQPTRISSYSETADRSERLRRYNLNETFSTSVLLTTIRDIPLEPPSSPLPSELIPAWKLIRPRKPKVLPHAEPMARHETKPERWIEITSPYINYPTPSALHITPTTRPHSIDGNISVSAPPRLNRSAKRSITPNPSNIIEIDEDEDIENDKSKPQCNTEFVRSTTSLGLSTTKKEVNVADMPEKSDESTRSGGSKCKRETPVDKTKTHQKPAGGSVKVTSDTASIKSKVGENEQLIIPIGTHIVGNKIDPQNSQSTHLISSKKSHQTSKIWIDFDDFCACFTSIIVFHNPRGYQYTHKHTEIKFTPYQPPIVTPVTREKKKESTQPVIQPIPNLPDDKSSLYLFVDSTRETLKKDIELIISLSCLPRWYDALPNEPIVSNEKTTRSLNISTEKLLSDINLAKTIVSQKEILPQTGSLLAERYSWKSLSVGQPNLRLHTTATKAALLTLPPGRHVLKLMNTCPFAFHLQILSDTNDFMLGDEDQLLNKMVSVPEDAEFLIRAEELFSALDDSIQNFHLINPQENRLHKLFRLYCQHAPTSIKLTIQTCLHAFNQALYSTLRTIINTSGSTMNVETQFAWRCFTNDRSSLDMLGTYETKRPSATSASRHSARTGGSSSATTTNKKSSGGKDKSSDEKTKQPSLSQSSSITDVQEEITSDWLTRELSLDEIDAITSIQKIVRGFLQRRIDLARQCGTEKNIIIQRVLQSTMSLLKVDSNKSALLLFKNFISIKPELIQCFSFRNDDWNMVTYRDYNGIYQEQSANTWFILFREIFYVTEENLIAAKFHSHLSNSHLRVINNDTYEEMSFAFHRLAPGMFTKNKYGYTFLAEGISVDQSIPNGRFRLRLITSYTHLPDIRVEQITSVFLTKEIIDYYLPNKQEIICRYQVMVADDIHQTGRHFHLASIRFSTSKSDVLMRLTMLDNEKEIISVEGKGSVVLPAILFMRTVSNVVQVQSSSRPSSKTAGTRRKDVTGTHRGSVGDLTAMNKERVGSRRRSRSISGTDSTSADGEEKSHKYIIQVTLLRKSWPLTLTQWRFIEQLKEQEKNESKTFNRQPSSPIKTDKPSSKRVGQTATNPSSTTGKGKGSSGKGSSISTGRPNTGKGNSEKTTIDINKPHWILRVVSDADKADELIIKKDTERMEELINIKKAWETFQTGRAEKAMQTRQKFLDSLHLKVDEQPSPEIIEEITNLPETPTDAEISGTIIPSVLEQPQVVKQTSSRKKSPSITKKGGMKEELSKQIEFIPPQPHIDEPLLDEPPPSLKPKITLPPLDTKPFIKRKLSSNESIITDSIFEQEDFERRQDTFSDYLKTMNKIHQSREDDYHHRSNEKLRQLEECIHLQSKIDQIRRVINEPREIIRQRFLQIERQRLEAIAFQQQKLLAEEQAKAAAAMIKPMKKKTSARKKK